PPPRGAAAGHPPPVQPARPATPGHPATPGRPTRTVHHRRVRPPRCTARGTAVHRIPLRPRPARTTGTRRRPRRDRRPAPPRTAPTAHHPVPPATITRLRASPLRRRRRTRRGTDHRARRPPQPTPHVNTHPGAMPQRLDTGSGTPQPCSCRGG